MTFALITAIEIGIMSVSIRIKSRILHTQISNNQILNSNVYCFFNILGVLIDA